MRSAFVWNTIAGLCMAFQSVVMLMVLMRVCSVEVAGIFTIAFATGSLFLNVGKFGVRNYQASDVDDEHSFSSYLRFRVLTCVAMDVTAFAYLAFTALSLNYSVEKIAVVILMILFKTIDAFEDVYYGNFQQHERLEVAGKILTARIVSTIAVFAIGVVITQELVMPMAISTVYTIVFLYIALAITKKKYLLPVVKGAAQGEQSNGVMPMLKECFPLFLSAFLLFYIGNAPKYAIDALLGDAEQAYYGFIAMPVFIVTLLAQFAYAPLIPSFTNMWNERNKVGFSRAIVRQIVIIGAITLICDVGTVLVGIPVLSLMYNADLSPYLIELVVLVSGGGFLALATLFTLGITIMRKQNQLSAGYVAVSVMAYFCSNIFVGQWGITGASWIYLLCMAVLSLIFGVIFVIDVRKAG